MTAIGDALKKAGLQTEEKTFKHDNIRITVETKIGYMKKHIDNIQRLLDKYYVIEGDEQEEQDVISALNNHFIYMVEAFKDVLNNIRLYKKQGELKGLRDAVRYFGEIAGEPLDSTVNGALETLIDRNDVAHRYEMYESISQKTLRNCVTYADDYKKICKILYAYCKQSGLIDVQEK